MPVIKRFGEDRIKRHRLSETEEIVLRAVVASKAIQVGDLAKQINKPQTQYLRCLAVC